MSLLSGLTTGLKNAWYNLTGQTYLTDNAKWTAEREDTAVQRRAADLKAAGLSPTLAAGSSASSSAPINNQGSALSKAQEVAQLMQMKKNIASLDADIQAKQIANLGNSLDLERAQSLGMSPSEFGNWSKWSALLGLAGKIFSHDLEDVPAPSEVKEASVLGIKPFELNTSYNTNSDILKAMFPDFSDLPLKDRIGIKFNFGNNPKKVISTYKYLLPNDSTRDYYLMKRETINRH